MGIFDPSLPSGRVPEGASLAYNGTTFDFARGNTSQVLMAASSISASTAISVTNFNGRGMYAFMNITSAFPGSGSTTLALKVKFIPPNASSSAVTMVASAAQSASGMTVLCVYPGLTTGSGSAATNVTTLGLPLPRDFQIVASYSSAAASAALTVSLGLSVIK